MDNHNELFYVYNETSFRIYVVMFITLMLHSIIIVKILIICYLFLQDSKIKGFVSMGSQELLEDKTVTICYGSDFVNLTFLNFCATRADIARHWADQILQLAYNLTQLNTSTIMFLQKAHIRLTLTADKSGKISSKK